jgi:hypothetical protein
MERFETLLSVSERRIGQSILRIIMINLDCNQVSVCSYGKIRNLVTSFGEENVGKRFSNRISIGAIYGPQPGYKMRPDQEVWKGEVKIRFEP